MILTLVQRESYWTWRGYSHKSCSEEAGHKEATHHEEAEHGHHEHGGIGETLETIFTVLGGLILLGAHYLNIRSIRESIKFIKNKC